ncbi:MAG: putative peptide zinc metalloprotease protein, partial [Pseudonocardiales bacterium]|nr:putative peptide zinc metalloprotease protein [Pseudonocardiales bacterium]
LPTKDQPRLSVVLSPRTPGAPTWVFPFNMPAPPGVGDNQTMAIVTKDGTTVYDVAFALVWVTDGDAALNRNEAYAFASCTRCKAVAVSFQVVLVVGSANVVAPQNISAAVNYNCVKCITEALAVQLVLTLPSTPSGDVLAQLTALWKRIARFADHVKGLTFAEIKAQIATFEQQILDVLQPMIASASSASVTSSVSGSSSLPGAPAPGPTDGSSVSSSAAPSSSSSAAPTTSSAPASTSEAPSTSIVPSAPASGP